MTNFEYIKNDDETFKCALAYQWGVNKKTGEVGMCRKVCCENCIFREFTKGCDELRKEWLEEEHINLPLYEEGDIVISKKGNLYLVFKECEGNLKDSLLVADNTISFDLGVGHYMNKDKIIRKVGNIKEEE